MDGDDALLLVGLGLLAYAAFDYLGLGADEGGDGGDETPPVSTDEGSDVLTAPEIYELAQGTLASMAIEDVTPQMVTTIAMIESSGDPGAVRQEPALGDESVGLMQTLTGTAAWLANSMGYSAYPSDAATLATPQASLYFGIAYLHWLRNYEGQVQSDEWVIEAYNGGPGNAGSAATQNYLAAYATMAGNLGYA